MLNTDRFEEFISQYPIYEYRLVDTAEIEVRERVRIICKQECERYGTTWACPPAVGSLEECGKRIHSYPNGILFSSVAEVSDVMNMRNACYPRCSRGADYRGSRIFKRGGIHVLFFQRARYSTCSSSERNCE